MYSAVSTFFVVIRAWVLLCLNFYILSVYGAISLKESASCIGSVSPSMQGEKVFKNETVVFDACHTRLTLAQSNTAQSYNWLFLPGGPGVDSSYFAELIELLNLPGNVWLIDFPENGSNKRQMDDHTDYDFSTWEGCLKHVLRSFDNAILVGHSFSGLYPLLFPEIEKDLSGLVILHSASRPWVDSCINTGNAKELPPLEQELAAFLAHPAAEIFDQFFKKAVHYYFTPQALQKGTELLSRGAWNYHALHWWLSQAAN